jgi:hypothetical protein
MAYDPADLRLPPWLIRLLDAVVAIRLPLGRGWAIGMTRPGGVMLFTLLGVWAAALYSANNLLYLCGSMLVLIAFAAVVQSWRILRTMPDLTPCFPTWVEAATPWMIRCDTAQGVHDTAVVNISTTYDCMQLRWWSDGTHSRLDGRIYSKHRELIQLHNMTYDTAAPVGLWSIHRRQACAITIPVLPAAMPWPHSISMQEVDQGNDPQAEGSDFHDLRGYVAGDAPARIHWRKAGADMQGWRVKRFARYHGAKQSLRLVVDLRLPAHADEQAFEHLLGMAWGWLKHHQEQGQTIEQVVIGQQLYPCNDDAQWQACRIALAQAQPELLPPLVTEGHTLSLWTAP